MATFDDEWIPQFPDGSGWNTEFEEIPHFYEHITPTQAKELEKAEASRLYELVCIFPDPRRGHHYHKNTYFVKGSYLDTFLKAIQKPLSML
jgi:hypothetical protein